MVMDVGDVLIRTVPTAHYRALAERVCAPWQAVAALIADRSQVAGGSVYIDDRAENVAAAAYLG
jgi:hypothetical protein